VKVADEPPSNPLAHVTSQETVVTWVTVQLFGDSGGARKI